MTKKGPEFNHERAVRSLDLRLFGYVPTETSYPDRRSLLALYNAVYDTYGEFGYLEIGSHLGGTLQVLLADKRCIAITSIDSRPELVPDAQREPIPYPENSTERMLKYLDLVPGGDLSKLRTMEASTENVTVEDIAGTPKLCFIDGEHTIEAAIRDARFCRAAIADEGVIAFHDRILVRPAIDTFLTELGDVPHESYPLPNGLLVVSCGGRSIQHLVHEMLAPHFEQVARLARDSTGGARAAQPNAGSERLGR